MRHVVEHECGVFGGSGRHPRLSRDTRGRSVTSRADGVALTREGNQSISSCVGASKMERIRILKKSW